MRRILLACVLLVLPLVAWGQSSLPPGTYTMPAGTTVIVPGPPPPTQYILTLLKAGTGNGIVSGGGSYPAGTNVTPTATAAPGSRFDGWTPTVPITMDANKSTTATFTLEAVPPTTGGGLGDVPVGLWVSLANTKVASVFPTPLPPGGSQYVYAYSGAGLLDTRGICAFGGGHNDSSDNSVYCFNPMTLVWTRAWGPSPNSAIPPQATPCSASSRTYADGNPSARHSYSQVLRLSPDRLLILGGSMWCAAGDGAHDAWVIDLATGTWTEVPAPSGTMPLTLYGVALTDGTVYYNCQESSCGLWRRTPAGVWSQVSPNRAPPSRAVTFDPKRNLIVYLTVGGTPARLGISTQNIVTGAIVTRSLTGTLPAGTLGAIDYEPVTDRVIVWSTGLTAINLDLNTATPLPVGGAVPGPPSDTGTYGRFRCAFGGVCLLARATDENVFAYRVAGATQPPVPPTEPPPTLPPTTLVPWAFINIPAPPFGGPASGSKHVTCIPRPSTGLVYCMGGDYQDSGVSAPDSYRQELYTFDLAKALAGDANRGWSRIQGYCQASGGGLQPKSPDYQGWIWDSIRRAFWSMPGTSFIPGQAVCPGRTVAEKDDEHFKYRHLMLYAPDEPDAVRRWTDWDATFDPTQTYPNWQGVHDATDDKLIRFIHHGGNGGGIHVYDVTAKASRYKWLENAGTGNLRLEVTLPCHDVANRRAFYGDPYSMRFFRLDLATETLTRLADVPGPSMSGTDPYFLAAWRPSMRECWVWNKGDRSLWVYAADTNTWRQEPHTQVPTTPQANVTNAIAWEPTNDVLLFLGTNAPGAGTGVWAYKPRP